MNPNKLNINKLRKFRFPISIFFLCIILFSLLDLLFPLPYAVLENDFSTLYMDRNGTLMHISLSPSQSFRVKLPLKEISPYLRKGFLIYEDKYFYIHPGVNPIAIFRAIGLNITGNRIRSGASTISMQVARMLEQRPRTFRSKLIELFRAFQLELHFSKKRILETYLNLVPMGGNIRGVGAASYFYFGKPSSELGIGEAALLIGLPNSPEVFRPDRAPEASISQREKVLRRISKGFKISPREIENVIRQTPPLQKYKNPYRCPHLIESKKEGSEKFLCQMTIDLPLQTYCEELLARGSDQNKKEGIYNGAIIIVDNATRDVLAYVGSPDYFDIENNGQVNGCRILRSPGSTLKPFLYARAFESGVLTPNSIVLDIPHEYGDYSPANFAKKSYGPVTATFALIQSLNIPAVRLEHQLGKKGLAGFLKSIYTINKDILIDKSGLTIPLGGFCMNLEQLAQLYTVLANQGLSEPLRYFLHEKKLQPRQILNETGCFMVSEILTEYERPDLPYNWAFTTYLAKTALKTGTSFGLRDAWCFGYNPRYTIGVWFGNVNCRDAGTLVGIRKAAPVFIDIFDHLTKNEDSWYKRPEKVMTRKICTVSGQLPGPYCTHLKDDYFIPGVSSTEICSIHRKIAISKKTGRMVCDECMTEASEAYTNKIVEIYPAEIARYLRTKGMQCERLPLHNPECPAVGRSDVPEIISPSAKTEFILDPEKPIEEQKILLRANCAQDVDKIYWFLENDLIAETHPDTDLFLIPQRGEKKLTVTDSRGRSSSIQIKVY